MSQGSGSSQTPTSDSTCSPSSGTEGTTHGRGRRNKAGRACVLPATPEDAQYIGHNLRESDIDELRGTGVKGNFDQVVLNAYGLTAPHCFIGLWDNIPFCIFGVSPTETKGYGSVWMLGTDGMWPARHYMRMFTLPWVEWMNSLYPFISNTCHAENTTTLSWLEAAGFHFGEPYPHEVTGEPFIPFWRTA